MTTSDFGLFIMGHVLFSAIAQESGGIFGSLRASHLRDERIQLRHPFEIGERLLLEPSPLANPCDDMIQHNVALAPANLAALTLIIPCFHSRVVRCFSSHSPETEATGNPTEAAALTRQCL